MMAYGVGHFEGNISGKGSNGVKNTRGVLDNVSTYHQNGHGFSNCPTGLQHDAGDQS